MNEEIEYAEMLEIPVSTVSVTEKRRKFRKNKGRQGRDADGGPAFGGDAARSRAHALSPDGMEN